MEVQRLLISLAVILAIIPSSYAVIITEIMYNPQQDENFNEYVEIYNPSNTTINLTEFLICDKTLSLGYIDNQTGDLNKNTTFILPSHKYALITDGGSGTQVYQNFNVSNQSLAFHVNAGSLCDYGLSNTNDTIIIKNSTHTVETMTYNDSLGADGNGLSLQLINGSFCQGFPTPGEDNSYCILSPITITNAPSTAKFGDFKLLHLDFNTSHYIYNSTTLLVFGRPKQIICNLAGTGITAGQHDSETTLHLSHLLPDATYPLAVPFFIKPNCNDYYGTGYYNYTLRMFDPDNEKYLDYPLAIRITGKNNLLCPDNDNDNSNNNYRESTQKDNLIFEIQSYESLVKTGKNITTTAYIKNTENQPQEFSIYSYIHSGLFVANTGGWTPNKQNITLQPQESTLITLKNELKEDIFPGTYTLKARIAFNAYKLTDSKEIQIVENPKYVRINHSRTLDKNLTSGNQITLSAPPEETQTSLIYNAQKYHYLHWILMAVTFGILCLLLMWSKD